MKKGSNVLSVVFRDVLFALMIGMMVILIMLLLLVKPVKQSDSEARSAGDIAIEVYWPDNRKVDIDVFVMGPDKVVVGYPNKRGRIFNLLRDDLGGDDDFSGKNYEFVYGRGVLDGEYVVSILYYSSKAEQPPKPVTVRVIVSMRGKYGMVPIYKGERILNLPKEEVGIVIFGIKNKKLSFVREIHERDALFWKYLNGE